MSASVTLDSTIYPVTSVSQHVKIVTMGRVLPLIIVSATQVLTKIPMGTANQFARTLSAIMACASLLNIVSATEDLNVLLEDIVNLSVIRHVKIPSAVLLVSVLASRVIQYITPAPAPQYVIQNVTMELVRNPMNVSVMKDSC